MKYKKKINQKIKPTDDFNILWKRLMKIKQLYVSDIEPKKWYTVDNIENYNNLENLSFINSNSIVSKFKENDIQVTVYADNNISKVQAHDLWNNNVTSIFIDDPTEYI